MPQAGVLVAATVAVAVLVWQAVQLWGITVDDSAISYTYARNLADGHGLVLWPGGERVEAYSNTLWVLILALAHVVGISLEQASKVLGVLASIVTIFMMARITARLRWSGESGADSRGIAVEGVGGRLLTWDFVPGIALALSPVFVLWTVAGLENALFAALLVAVVDRLMAEEAGGGQLQRQHGQEGQGGIRRRLADISGTGNARGVWSALLLFGLMLTRPEAPLYVAAAVLHRFVQGFVSARSRNEKVANLLADMRWLTITAMLCGLFFLWRRYYFGLWLPNTYYIKNETFNFSWLSIFDFGSKGWKYLISYFVEHGQLMVLAAIPFASLLGRKGGTRAVGRLFLVIFFAGAAAFFPIYSGGDWMYQYRFLTSLIPFVLVLGWVGLYQLIVFSWDLRPTGVAESGSAGLAASTRGLLGIGVLVAFAALGFIYTNGANGPAKIREIAAAPGKFTTFEAVGTRGLYFAEMAQQLGMDNSTLLDPDLGGTSFLSGMEVIDLFGLADTSITRHRWNQPLIREYLFNERLPGFIHLHGAWFKAYRLEDYPELRTRYLRLPSRSSSGLQAKGRNYVARESFAGPFNYWLAKPPFAGDEGSGGDRGSGGGRWAEHDHGLRRQQVVMFSVGREAAEDGAGEVQGQLTGAGGGRDDLEELVYLGVNYGLDVFRQGENRVISLYFMPGNDFSTTASYRAGLIVTKPEDSGPEPSSPELAVHRQEPQLLGNFIHRTGQWLPGESVKTEMVLQIPAHLEDGEYLLKAQLVRQSMARTTLSGKPVSAEEAAPVEVVLGKVRVGKDHFSAGTKSLKRETRTMLEQGALVPALLQVEGVRASEGSRQPEEWLVEIAGEVTDALVEQALVLARDGDYATALNLALKADRVAGWAFGQRPAVATAEQSKGELSDKLERLLGELGDALDKAGDEALSLGDVDQAFQLYLKAVTAAPGRVMARLKAEELRPLKKIHYQPEYGERAWRAGLRYNLDPSLENLQLLIGALGSARMYDQIVELCWTGNCMTEHLSQDAIAWVAMAWRQSGDRDAAARWCGRSADGCEEMSSHGPQDDAGFSRANLDFEEGTWHGWTVEGRAFGDGPTYGPVKAQTMIVAYTGQYLANSYHGGKDRLVGEISAKLDISNQEHQCIAFELGGGNKRGKLGVELVVDGEVVRSATGKNDSTLRRFVWPVDHSWRSGEDVVVRVVDRQKGGAWGHILFDNLNLLPKDMCVLENL